MAASFRRVLLLLILPLALRWLRLHGYISSAKAIVLEFGLDTKAFLDSVEVGHDKSDFPDETPPQSKAASKPEEAKAEKKSTFFGLEADQTYPE